MSRSKKSLKQKLAMTLSVINTLNVCAPIALPYVNVARDMSTGGGHAEPLSDGLARAFYGTAQANTASYTPEVPIPSSDTVHNEIIPDGGTQNVNEGGTTQSTTVNSGGTQNVNNGGYATHTSVNNSGVQNVSSGGTTNATHVNEGGVQNVSSGGTTNWTSVNSGGTQNVLNGGTANGTHVNNGGTQDATAGGVLDGTQPIETGGVASGGTLIGVQNVAGTATDITVNSGGTQNVNNGGRAEDTTVNSGGRQNVNDGGTAEGTTVNSGGTQIVSAGGTASGTILNIGSAHDTTLDCPGGVQIVSSGGTAVNTTVYGTTNNYVTGVDGTQIVSSGGVARGTKDAGGVLELHNGAVLQKADGTSMGYGDYALSGGILRVTDGVSVNYSTYALSNGTIEVTTGGTASIKSVGPQGIQILSGGSASGTVETLDGYQKIYSGGTGSATVMGGYAGNAAHQEIYSGGAGTIGTMNYGKQTVNSGGTGTVSTLSGGQQVVYSGGTGTVVTMKGGQQVVSSGGLGTVSTLSGGQQVLYSGGTGTVTALMSGGTQVLYTSGTSLNTIVKSGGMLKEETNEATITSVTFEEGGIHHLANGATKSGMAVAGHILEVGNGGTATNTSVNNGGTARVLNGGKMSGGAVNSGGVQNVSSGGTATNATVNDGGVQNILSGGVSDGTASSGTTVSSGGKQNIASGGTAKNTKIEDGGLQTVSSGGTATDTTVNAGGTQDATEGGVIAGGSNVVLGTAKGGVLISGAAQEVKGTASGTLVSGTQVVNGGTATDVRILSGGTQQVGYTDTSGNIHSGTATGTVVSDGGVQNVSSGSTATDTILNGGTQTVESGGKAENVTVNGGTQNIASGGVASGGTLNSGTQNIASGGQATGATLNGGTQNIASGGQATSTNVSGGTQSIASGGQATGATVAERGTQIISAGGTATNTRVLSGGTQNVRSGGVVSGGTVEKGAALAFENPEDVKGVSGDGGMIISQDGGVDGGTLIRGEHDVVSGVTVSGMTLQGGAQTIASGGTAVATTISAGAAQTLNAGGTATSTTISAGGVQTLQKGTPNSPGGVSEHIALEGGTLIVDDYARAQIDESTGGVLRLLDLGLAEAQFGDANTAAGTTFNLATLYARGDTVTLGTGEGIPGKRLVVTNMDGYANFVVNTDLANNKSDQIEIGTATNASKANTIKINYDPTLAKKQTVASTNTKVATVKSGKATFVGAKSTIGGVDYLPTVETKDGGASWYITGLDSKGASDNTHHTLMGMTAGMAALAAGTAFINDATDGLGLMANTGKDGVSTFAKFGGGAIRQETGSHVDVKTWNAILALGHANKKERGTFEYGAFFEYGSGNYATHENDLRGDGSMDYTGGGLLAKWTAAHGFYVEGSFRAGAVHDDAKNVLHDDVNTYSYDTNANYFGAHIGVGKEIEVAGGNTVDVYGKFFYNRRNGVSFETGGNNYDLDAVKSEILRVGVRYTMKRDKWNFYGGAAYEHEFGGEATGTVDGHAIRGADIGGGSFRGEIGATMQPGENSPWKLDLNLAGFAGKKQGVSGGISVAFMF